MTFPTVGGHLIRLPGVGIFNPGAAAVGGTPSPTPTPTPTTAPTMTVTGVG